MKVLTSAASPQDRSPVHLNQSRSYWLSFFLELSFARLLRDPRVDRSLPGARSANGEVAVKSSFERANEARSSSEPRNAPRFCLSRPEPRFPQVDAGFWEFAEDVFIGEPVAFCSSFFGVKLGFATHHRFCRNRARLLGRSGVASSSQANRAGPHYPSFLCLSITEPHIRPFGQNR
jgi:hypothetical protein